MKFDIALVLGLILFCGTVCADTAEELKAYYEKQKAEIAAKFTPPELGIETTITLLGGKKRTGILMKLNAAEVALMTGAGMVSYKPEALDDSTRVRLFAEDYAHLKAVEKLNEFKQQRFIENIHAEQAGLHEGRISVSAKTEKDSDRRVEEEERESRKTGASTTIRTTTKTETEIQKLTITVANNTTHPDTYTLSWYFLARSVGGDRIRVHDRGSQEIAVPARQRERVSVSSQACIEETIEVERSSSEGGGGQDPKISTSGTESAGYVVLLKHGDTLLDAEASASTFLSEEWMKRFR